MTGTPRTGLYIHWPFCARICPYCDFTVARAREVDEEGWTVSLLEDLRHMGALAGPRPLVSVYFGGGTPSLMPAASVARVLDAADTVFGIAEGAEITLEANPTDAERSRFTDFRAAGVNRLSLGVQSMDDGQLAFLRRNHDAEEAQRALATATDVFPKHTADLIYALPGETAAQWRARLTQAIELGIVHLSLYQLTIESGTPFGRAARRGTLAPVPDERAADLYALTQEVTEAAGLPGYEVSNHARPGGAAVHNSLYWDNADWIGIGPGAHGRLTGTAHGARIATAPSTPLKQWLTIASAERYSIETLSEEQIAMEALAGGLRRTEGMDAIGRFGAGVDAQIHHLEAEGAVAVRGSTVLIRPAFRLLTDHVVSRITAAL